MRLAWIDQQWNKPSRTDYYLMQIAQTFLQTKVKKGVKVKLEKFIIPFVKKVVSAKQTSVDTIAAVSKAVWFARIGRTRKNG